MILIPRLRTKLEFADSDDPEALANYLALDSRSYAEPQSRCAAQVVPL